MIVGPGGEGQIAHLLVEGIPLHVDVTHRREQGVAYELHVAGVHDNGVGVDDCALVVAVRAGWRRLDGELSKKGKGRLDW